MSDLPFLTDEEELAEDVQLEENPPAEAETKGEPEPAAPPAAQPEEIKHVPLTALLDEREKRQKIERELELLRQQQPKPEPTQKPDFYADPEAAIAQAQALAVQAALQTKLETSRFMAVKEFGEDTVREAYAFFDANPQLSQDLLRHASPFHEAVNVYRKFQAAQEIGGDPVAYRAKLEEEIRAKLMAEMTPQAPKAPPPSMAAAPGTGSGKAPPVSGFTALFERE